MPRAEPCLSTSFQSRDELPEVPDMVGRLMSRGGMRMGGLVLVRAARRRRKGEECIVVVVGCV
jgi:hypothetical protein